MLANTQGWIDADYYENEDNEQVYARIPSWQCELIYDYSTPVQCIGAVQYYKTKDTQSKENPFDLLEEDYLVDEKGDIQEFYTCNVKGEALDKITLSDFVNNGVEFVKKETKYEHK